MISLWKVRIVEVAATPFYQVYRTTDAVKNNLETRGGYYTTREEAEALARRLNTEDVTNAKTNKR